MKNSVQLRSLVEQRCFGGVEVFRSCSVDVAEVLFRLLPLGMAFAFLGVQLAVFGLYMGASFAPNHVGMPIVPRDAKLDFLNKQVRTSRNIGGGWWATALMGGLNYQIEHHLSRACHDRT